EPNPEVILRVEFPAGPPADIGALHWRGRSYNLFDGYTWSRAERGAVAPNAWPRWPAPVLEQVIYARPLADANVLFGLHPVVSMTPESRIRPVRAPSGDYVYFGDADPAYRVRSRAGRPAADSLRAVAMTYAPEVMAHLQLPPTSARVLALADSFRSEADNVYDHVVSVERWLRTAFSYTLDLPGTPREATLDHFLFERRAGHCEYFSTTMAVLLRAGGIPARNVNGFLGGDWNEFGGFLTVTQNDAHSWVEVYFPGWGWVEFDPTPAGGAAGVAGAGASFGPLRFFLDGIEHRWSKWVLDYDLGTQTSLLNRALSPFAQEQVPAGGTTADERSGPWLLLALAVAACGFVVLIRRLRVARRPPHAMATRAYLAL
ncbi:MAG: transglutaminase domain-containing protein, partial [Gemmatimonadota bacterium]